MNCIAFRNAALTDPDSLDPEQMEHFGQCPGCVSYLERIRGNDMRIKEIFTAVPPPDLAKRIKLCALEHEAVEHERIRKPDLSRRRAIAASVVAVAVIGGGAMMLDLTERRIASQFRISASNYIASRPELLEIPGPVDPDQLSRLVNAFGGTFIGELEGVRFAEPCDLEPVPAAHLIIDSPDGPVTAMYSSEATLEQPFSFESNRMKALHYPVNQGSVALFGESSQSLQNMSRRLSAAISW